ncbi:MAG: hypothetical protein HY982_00170 [Candidatus Magasanikbacteria bacterium]|nr:hypothetical protein [Candidatus Magasanikbacteria bacterium]
MFHFQEKKFIYLTGAASLASLLLIFGIIYPKAAAIKNLNQKITALRSELEIKHELAKQIHKSNVNLATAKKLTEDLNSRFLKKGEEIKLITLLEKKAEKFNLNLSLSLDSSYQKTEYDLFSLALSFSLSGDFANLLRFLDELQNNSYFFSITDLSFFKGKPANPAVPPTASPPITLTFKAMVYAQD